MVLFEDFDFFVMLDDGKGLSWSPSDPYLSPAKFKAKSDEEVVMALLTSLVAAGFSDLEIIAFCASGLVGGVDVLRLLAVIRLGLPPLGPACGI